MTVLYSCGNSSRWRGNVATRGSVAWNSPQPENLMGGAKDRKPTVISPDYMLEKPPGPSAAKVFLDTRVIPAAIDIAGTCEVALEQASKRTGLSVPVLLTGIGALL